MRASGTFSTAVDSLGKKALKVIFMIRRKFQNEYGNTKLLLKLFDSCVKPILLYGSELWGMYSLNLDKKLTVSGDKQYVLESVYQNFSPEKIHIRYCKFVLGVNKYASNIASLSELGRYPLSIFVIIHSLKYWLYLYKNPFENYSKIAYKSIEYIDGRYAGTFNNHIYELLRYVGFDHVWKNKGTMCERKLIFAILKTLQKRYDDFFFHFISGESHTNKERNKLRTYHKIKKNYTSENYTYMRVAKDSIKHFCKLRISNHNLEIEKGRYKNIPANQRLCKYCQLNRIEDEMHFICDCVLYKEEREKLFANITSIVPHFTSLSNHDRFEYLMTCNEPDILGILLPYIDKCFHLRNSSEGMVK